MSTRERLMGPTEMLILKVVIDQPGITISGVCRALNGHHIRDCYHCKDFANPERRARTRIDTPICKPRLWTVRKAVYRLR